MKFAIRREPIIERTSFESGANPFEYGRVLEEIANNDTTVLQRVANPLIDGDRLGRGAALLRKVKKISEWKVRDLQRREAEFLIEANHPTLPRVFGFFEGIVDGEIVTSTLREYVPGKNLEQVVRDHGTIELVTAVNYAEQILDGLAYIHSKGFLHRDVKPSNLIRKGDAQRRRRRGWEKNADIVLMDMDALGRKDLSSGMGGSTIGVGTDGWHHPNQYVGLATVKTDLYAVGTTLFYLLTGEKPEMETTKHGVSVKSSQMERLEAILRDQQGGPEVYKMVHNLVNINLEGSYESAREVMEDIDKVQSIFNYGYESVSKDFRVYQEPWNVKWKRFTESTGTVVRRLFANPIQTGLLVALALGPTAGVVTSSMLEQASIGRAVHITQPIEKSAPVAVRTSAAISNTSNKVNAFYVEVSGGTEKKPNAIAIQREVKEAQKSARETRQTVAEMSKVLVPFNKPMKGLVDASNLIRSSYVHDKDDNYHTEVYTVRVCHQTKNGQSCHSELRTKQVYDDTDHYWTFHPDKAEEAVRLLRQSVKEIQEIGLPAGIDIADYIRTTVEAGGVDAVGRKIDVKDMEKYTKGENEWIEKGLPQYINAMNRLGMVTDNPNVIKLLELHDGYEGQGFSVNTNVFPLKHHVNNRCSGCDEQGSPLGYRVTKHASKPGKEYVQPFYRIAQITNQTPERISQLLQELDKVNKVLESGENLDHDHVIAAADKATDLYKTMVPNSIVAAPTSGQRVWIPIGVALAFGFLGGFGAGALRQKQLESQMRYRRYRY